MPAFVRLILAILVLVRFSHAEDKPSVQIETYKGWPGSLVFSGGETKMKAVVVPAVGGRVLHFGPPDENIMFESPGSDGKTLANTKGGFWVGGYQLDIGPETRGLPAHENLWKGQYTISATATPYSVTVTSENDPATGIQLQKEFTFDPKTGALTIVGKMKNIKAEGETQFCLWDRTLCKGGGFAFFPLNKKSRFAAGLQLRLKEKGPDAFTADTKTAANVKVLDGVLVCECKGTPGKLGADSDAGWMAYARGKQLYIKSFAYFPDGNYCDMGNSVEVYWSPQVGEIEPLSPEVKLKPGAEYTFTERWQLLTLAEEVTTFEAARALVDNAAAAAAELKK